MDSYDITIVAVDIIATITGNYQLYWNFRTKTQLSKMHSLWHWTQKIINWMAWLNCTSLQNSL